MNNDNSIAAKFYGLQKEIETLEAENKELKETNKILANEFSKDSIIHQDSLRTCCGIPIDKIPKLLEEKENLCEENKGLKRQLEKLKNGYKIKLEKLLAEGMEPDSEDFYLAEIEGKANDYDKLLNQQKKFTKYLENMLDDENNIFSVVKVKDVLQKYKSVIGDIDDKR